MVVTTFCTCNNKIVKNAIFTRDFAKKKVTSTKSCDHLFLVPLEVPLKVRYAIYVDCGTPRKIII